jgi:hypothetical protein
MLIGGAQLLRRDCTGAMLPEADEEECEEAVRIPVSYGSKQDIVL